MRVGKLDSLVSIERLTATRDPATGAVAEGWVTLGQDYANILFKTGAEAMRADTTVSTANASILIRHRSDVDAKCRVVHGNTVFNVQSVLPQGRAYLHLACQTEANNG